MAEHHDDSTFYRSPRDAAAGPPEKLAYVAAFVRPADKPDAIAVVDTDSASESYASVVGVTELPHLGDELHHFGWNACSSALCPTGDHKHGDRRYLVVPGIRSSRVYILDTKDNPAEPTVTKLDAPQGGGMTFDDEFFLEGAAFAGRRAHQVRLEGGDASSDSYCYS